MMIASISWKKLGFSHPLNTIYPRHMYQESPFAQGRDYGRYAYEHVYPTPPPPYTGAPAPQAPPPTHSPLKMQQIFFSLDPPPSSQM